MPEIRFPAYMPAFLFRGLLILVSTMKLTSSPAFADGFQTCAGPALADTTVDAVPLTLTEPRNKVPVGSAVQSNAQVKSSIRIPFKLESYGLLLPNDKAQIAAILTVAADDEKVLLTVSVLDQSLKECRRSDLAGAQQRLLMPAIASGFIDVQRVDLLELPSTISLRFAKETLKTPEGAAAGKFVDSLSRGYAYRQPVGAVDYLELVNFGECDFLKRGLNCVNPDERKSKSISDRTLHLYESISDLVGRQFKNEFPAGKQHSSESEPMVVFLGLGGLNKFILLHCNEPVPPIPKLNISPVYNEVSRPCKTTEDPWNTSLERADYVWAIYLEDDQSPFETSIQVEFKASAPDVDYEEFDFRSQSRLRPIAGEAQNLLGTSRLLRIGFRRIRIREAPIAVQIAFTRQSPEYGLRQWTKVYRKYSDRWIRFSAGLFFPAMTVRSQKLAFENELDAQGHNLIGHRITQIDRYNQVFGTLALSWPQLRGAGRFVPGPIFGVGLSSRGLKAWFVGGAWPIAFRERLSFAAGYLPYRSEVARQGYYIGQVQPLNAAAESVIGEEWNHQFRVGFSLNLMSTH